MSKTVIEFVDRYGGRYPSALRVCRGQCEGTGSVPVRVPCDDLVLEALWLQAEATERSDDGWHFVTCPECAGTGRVSWLKTLLRLPAWLWRGPGRFASLLRLGRHSLRHWLLCWRIAWIDDLRRLWN